MAPEISPVPSGRQAELLELSDVFPEYKTAGPVEAGIIEQVANLREGGWISDLHAGHVALAIRAARDVDQSAGRGAPSGRANLLRVMNEILGELPAPEAGVSDALDRALEAITGGTAGE